MTLKRSAFALLFVTVATVVTSGRQGGGQNIGPGGMAVSNPMTPLASSQPKGTGLILGRVLDADGKPVPEPAIVLSGTTPQGDVAQRSLADTGGRFLFRELPKGRYTLSVSAPGYLPGAGYAQRRAEGEGQSFDLEDGQKVTDLEMRMWRPASIEGTVTDEQGEPLVRLEVWVLRRGSGSRSSQYVPAESRFTDDRGVYRAWRLFPGEYIVAVRSTQMVAPAAATQGMESFGPGGILNPTAALATPSYRVGDLIVSSGLGLSGPPPGPDGRMSMYPTTFHPSTNNPLRARTVVLRAGDHPTGVDIQMKLVPTFRISGTVAASDGASSQTNLTLVSTDIAGTSVEGRFPTGTARTAPDGTFTFLGVPTGSYSIKGVVQPPFNPNAGGGNPTAARVPEGPAMWASLPVTVGEGDVTGLTLSFQQALRIRGRVLFESTSPRPAPDVLARFNFGFTVESGLGPYAMAQLGAGDVFESGTLVPGDYLLTYGGVRTAPWRLKSAMLNGRDISDQPVALQSGDVNDVIVTFTDKPNQVSGVVRGTNGLADPNVRVVLVPRDAERWSQRNARSLTSTRVAKTGTYSFSGVPAGDYLILAVDDAITMNWSDPSWIQAASRIATPLSVGPDDQKVVDLRTATIR